MNGTTGPDEWIARDSPIDLEKLYLEVEGAMRQAARTGLWRTIGRQPNDHDVEDAMLQAFNELCEMDFDSLRSPAAMGHQIAYRRGQGRGRRVLREQKELVGAIPDDAIPQPSLDVVNEPAFAARAAAATRWMDRLTMDQRAVVLATIVGSLGEEKMKLSEWAALPQQRAAKTYEAWRQERKRALQLLRCCAKKEQERGNDLDA